MNKVSLSEALTRNSLDRAVNPAVVRRLAFDFFNTPLGEVFPDEVQNDYTKNDFLEIFDTDNKDIPMIEGLKRCREIAIEKGELNVLFILAVLAYIPDKKHHRLFDHNLFDYLDLSPNAADHKKWFQNECMLYKEKHGHFPSVYNVLANMLVQVDKNSIKDEDLKCRFLDDPPSDALATCGIERPFCRSVNDPYETILVANRIYILMTQIPYDLYQTERR